MSDYIVKTDYHHRLRDARLEQIIEEDDTVLDEAEETAIQMVKDALCVKYDIETIFSKTGTERHKNVVRWVTDLAIYYIYERIPDKLVPQRVIKNYDDTRDTLMSISDGKMSVDLPVKTDADGVAASKFRWGSLPPRSF